MHNKNKMTTTFWKDKPVFITGATGLVGGWLVKKLVELEADIVCLVRDWVPQCELVQSRTIERVKVVRGDIRDQALLQRILGEYEINTVFHLAAQTTVVVANTNPITTFESNIAGSWSLFEACRQNPKVQQIILASSDKAYGSNKKLPYDEQTPLKGEHPYDVSKSCADLLAQSYAQSYELPIAITRCGNFYGGGDLNWNRIVPGTIRSIIRGERPVIRSDGKYIRDYFYVEDGVYAYLLLAEKLAQDKQLLGEAFNFSNEKKLTVLELTKKILKLMESNLEPTIMNNISNEIKEQYLSAQKARDILGWKPTFSLDESLLKTIKWYQNHFGVTHG